MVQLVSRQRLPRLYWIDRQNRGQCYKQYTVPSYGVSKLSCSSYCMRTTIRHNGFRASLFCYGCRLHTIFYNINSMGLYNKTVYSCNCCLPLIGLHSNSRLLALPANIRLVNVNGSGKHSSLFLKRFYSTGSRGRCYKTNTVVIYCYFRLNYRCNVFNIEFTAAFLG